MPDPGNGAQWNKEADMKNNELTVSVLGPIHATGSRARILNLAGMAYGACWGLLASGVIFLLFSKNWSRIAGLDRMAGETLADLIMALACMAPALAVGVVVTRVCGGWLRGRSGWTLLWVAPVSLLMGTMLLGLAHATIVETYGLALGKSFGGGKPLLLVFPFWYAVVAFLFPPYVLLLAFLNCWHLRKLMERLDAVERVDGAVVWKV